MILKAVLNGMFGSNCYILGDNGEAAVIDPGADVEDIVQVLEENALNLKYIIITHAHIDHIAEIDNLRSTAGGKAVVHEDDAPLLGDMLLNGSALFGRGRIFGKADILVKDGDVLELGNARLRVIHTPGHTPGGICILLTVNGEECVNSGTGYSEYEGKKCCIGKGSAESGIGYGEVDECGSCTSEESADSSTGCDTNDDSKSSSVEEDTLNSGNSSAYGTNGGSAENENCIFTGDTLFRLSIGRTDLGAGSQRKLIESVRRLMELDGSLKVYPGHGPATTIEYERQNNPWI
jgi:glyoxylase-like metal-dependent hydrolase (beta-lactamase superfamily II)